MAITFAEVTQEVINLVRLLEELKKENEQLKAALQASLKNVREPDNKNKE